jgi:hypothetical protein
MTGPSWSWSKEGNHIHIAISVPNLVSLKLTLIHGFVSALVSIQTRAHISEATLDIEPRRLIFQTPPFYFLDINISLSDAELAKTRADQELNNILTLKRIRDLDVEDAKARWIIADGKLIVTA